MAANFNKPDVTDNYSTGYTAGIVANFVALAQGLDPATAGASTSPPTDAVRWNSANTKWEKYNGSTWGDLAATYAIAISGNAGTATKWAAGRTIALTGDVTGTSGAFDGSGNLSFSTTLATVTVGKGGTGVTTLTGLVYGNGTSAMTAATGAQIASALGTTAVTNASNAATLTGSTTAAISSSALGSGTANSSKVLLGDRTWGTPPASVLTMNTARLLGRTTAGSGAAEEISVGAGLTLSGGALSASSGITLGTAVNSTSGTAIDFTGIPSSVKRITVMLNGVSTSGTSELLIQIGDSGGIEITGYTSTSANAVSGTSSVASSSTAGFVMRTVLATNIISGHMIITSMNSNVWISSHAAKGATTFNISGGGDKTLSGTLDRIRITTVNGTDTFDAGSINIMYEG